MNRGWMPLVLGLALGAAAGLAYAWVLDPVEVIGTSPAGLSPEAQADYLTLIASSYAATGDLPRAQARLGLFPGSNTAETLGALAQARLAMGRPLSEAQSLARLAGDLGLRPSPLPSPTPLTTAPPPAASATPVRSATPRPSPTVTRTPGAPFQVDRHELVCDADLRTPRIRIVVLDSAGQGVAGVEVQVLWDAGQDRFYTGLKPELGIGYGDFEMTVGVTYTVRLAESGALVTGLTAEPCTDSEGATYPGSWSLTFIQPAQP
jgi:hypothetical protein